MNRILLSIAFSLLLYPVFAQGPAVLSVREQAAVVDGWLEDRIQQVLPTIMTESGIDFWIVVSREYNEDPVIRTLLPATWHAARRRTILVMYQPGPNAAVETYAVAVTMWANPLRKPGTLKRNRINGKPCWPSLKPKNRRKLV
jgi:hypothetical protein